MKVGFTGTRDGMTLEQKFAFCEVINNISPAMTEFRHGDCIGCDEEAHKVIQKARLSNNEMLTTCIHPPINETYRAWCHGAMVKVGHPKEYLDRNHDIVDASEFMIACPGEMDEKLRSGTWATIRYSKKTNTDICIIFPDGSMEGEIKHG